MSASRSESETRASDEFKDASEGILGWMREADVTIGYFVFTLGDEPVVVLVGRSERADDLTAAYEAMNVEVVYAQSFDPPLSPFPPTPEQEGESE